MTTPRPDKATIARLSALFALEKLSPPLLSAVIADGALVRELNLTATAQPVQLGPDSTVMPDALFAAFTGAAEGNPVRVNISVGAKPAEATVSINPEGAALIETLSLKVQFAHAALWTNDLERRRTALGAALRRYTVA